MKLGSLIEGLGRVELTGSPDVEIEHIEYDSRLLKKDSLFFAVKGFRQDGYDFVEQAKASGAVCVMGEREGCGLIKNHVTVPNVRKAMADVAARFYGYPGMNIKACGVTGTNGKTTVCHLMKAILEARNKTAGLVTSSIYDTGRETFAAERTTPESLDLQRLLLLMKKNRCVNAVIEVSSHALALHRVDNISFRVVIYTNLTRDHLDFHKSMEDYFRAKASLLEKLAGPLSYAVINLDVPEFRPLFGECATSHISYSLGDTSADVHCSNFETEPDQTVFDLVTPMGNRTVDFKLPGKFNVANALAAAAGGLASGVDLDNVVRGLESARPVPGRFNYLDAGQPFAVYVDYAHTPDAIERLCQAAREVAQGKVLILFGCGGDRDTGKRSMMGKAATAGADHVVVTSDNPRSEDPLAVIEAIKPGLEGSDWETCPDRREAIATVLKRAQPHDVVLLAGKGAESYQEINGVKHPFDDATEARKVLAEMGYSTPQGKERN